MALPRFPFPMQGVPGGLAESVDDMGASMAAEEAAKAAKAQGIPVGPAAGSAFVSNSPGAYVPTPSPPTTPDVGTNPGVPGSSEGSRDTVEGTNAYYAARNIINPYMPSGGAIGPTLLGEGEDPYTIGGLEGRSRWDEISRSGPERVESGFAQLGQAEEDLGTAKANTVSGLQKFQAEQLSVLRQRQMERQAEIADRQKQVDAATKRYSDDLADTGKFWRNPGNIIAAIGASLMTLGSGTTGDYGIGMRVINQAIQQDWKQRKDLADMHLGELRSNLSAYRQIAGDADLGDRMALNESYRIAAMELDRVSAQFGGKIAKQKLGVMSDQLKQQYAQNSAQLYYQFLYNKPQLTNPLIKGNYEAGGGYHAFAPPGSPGGLPKPKSAAVSGAAGVQAPKLTMQSLQGPQGGQPGVPSAGDSWRNTSPGISSVEDRQTGLTDQMSAARRAITEEKLSKIGMYGRINPDWSDAKIAQALPQHLRDKWNHESNVINARLDSENEKLGPRLQPLAGRMEMYRNFGKKLQEVNVIAEKLGIPPDELIGTRAEQLTPDGLMKKYREWVGSGKADGAHEIQEQEKIKLINRFRQTLNQAVNMYTHDMYAGNVSAGEQDMRNKYVNQSYSWDTLTGFYNDISGATQSEAQTALGAASPPTQILWSARFGLGPKVLSFKGTPGYVRKEQNETRGNVPKDIHEAQKGTKDDPEVLRAIDNLKKMSGKK